MIEIKEKSKDGYAPLKINSSYMINTEKGRVINKKNKINSSKRLFNFLEISKQLLFHVKAREQLRGVRGGSKARFQ